MYNYYILRKETYDTMNKNTNNSSDRIISKDILLGDDIEIEKMFIKHNYDMMIELGKIGVVIVKSIINENDGLLCYESTLPFKYNIKDEKGEQYTNYSAAQKAKQIIKEARDKIQKTISKDLIDGLFKDKDFHFYYKLRDDIWDEERRDKYVYMLIKEKDKLLSELDKQFSNN